MITKGQVQASRQVAGRVQRWHTWPMIRRPTVAEHSARVATLYVELWGMPRAEVLYYCLCHDMGEQTAGDVPFGAKRLIPELGTAVNLAESLGRACLGIALPTLTAQEFSRFKVCDLMEMYETCMVELNMGNRYVECSMQGCLDAARGLVSSDDAAALKAWVQDTNQKEC